MQWSKGLGMAVLGLLLGACGGSDTPPPAAPAASCELPAQKDWLREYLQGWYFWAGRSPDASPEEYDTLPAYLDALRFQGDATSRGDVWSFVQSTASYQQFYGEGRTMGYGLFVNGVERSLPLRVRMVEPLGPAARAGLARGDRIVSIDGVSDAELIRGDFSSLSPAMEGDRIRVVVETAQGMRTVELSAAVHELTPVPTARVLALPGGRKAGYLVLKDFIPQAQASLETAFAEFAAEGATELIIDLRYNGGGRISVANRLASLAAGARHAGELFVQLRHNAARHAYDQYLRLYAAGPQAYPRVVVLTGSRTCSASELVVNGLTPYAEVVTIGGTTCGKPYGFDPVASCGNTFNVVNFESLNARGAGGYDEGLAPTCPLAEDFTRPFGDPEETLTAAALGWLQTGQCPANSGTSVAARSPRRAAALEPGERRGMSSD